VAGIRERLSPVAGDAVSLADWDRLVGAVQREVVGATVLIGEELTGGLGALVADVVHELGVDPGRRPGPRAVPSPELEATVALRLQGLAWRLLSVPGLPLSTSSPLSLLVHDGGSGWPRDASSGERTAVVANLAELLDTTALELTDAVHRLAVEAEAVIVEEVATRIRERDREREAVAALPDTAVDPLTLAARVGELVSRMPAPAPAPVGTGP
jgi:hypothetical protein